MQTPLPDFLPSPAQQVVEILCAEMRRQSGFLSYDDVIRVISRRKLVASDADRVWCALEGLGISVVDAELRTLENESRASVNYQAPSFWQDLLPGYNASIQLLTHAEEILLGRRVRAGELLSSEGKIDDDVYEHESVLILAREAKAKLILHNLRLVVGCALHFKKRTSHALEDLFQEGILGLNRAAEKYEPDRGYRFATYATWWIYQRIMRYIDLSGRTVRVPSNRVKDLRTFRAKCRSLAFALSRKPTEHELAHELGISESEVQLLIQIGRDERSLDADGSQDGMSPRHEFLVASTRDPALEFEHQELTEIMVGVLDTLDGRSRKIIASRFGLEGDAPKTLEELAEELNLTRERIRQIESRALDKLSQPFRSDRLRAFLDFDPGDSRPELPTDEQLAFVDPVQEELGVANG